MKNKITAILLAVLMLMLCGCSYIAPKKSDRLSVVCSIFAPYDFARRIAGDRAEVKMLLPTGVESHSYEPTPRDIIELENSDIFFYVSEHTETWVTQITDAVENESVKKIDIADELGIVINDHDHDHGHHHGEEHDEHDESGTDEHIWTDLETATKMIDCIAKEMGKPVTAAFHVQPENITSTIHLGKNKKANELLYEWFRDDFYNEFTHIHCPSPFIAGQLKEHGYQAKLHIISNGVSDEFYPRVRQKEPELAHKFVILMIGRYSEEKRQDVLIEAVKRSAHSHRIQLILAGQGPKERSLRWQGRSLRYPPIMGFFDTERLCELMAMSDLYVHAADVEIEAIACLEAVASGLVPVIADSPLSATSQFALDHRSLFEAGNVDDLAERIDWWYEHATARHQMARVYAESANQYRLKNSIRKAEQMFAEEIAETLG